MVADQLRLKRINAVDFKHIPTNVMTDIFLRVSGINRIDPLIRKIPGTATPSRSAANRRQNVGTLRTRGRNARIDRTLAVYFSWRGPHSHPLRLRCGQVRHVAEILTKGVIADVLWVAWRKKRSALETGLEG